MFELLTGWHWLGLATLLFIVEFLTLKNIAAALGLAALLVALVCALDSLPGERQAMIFCFSATVCLAVVGWRWHMRKPETRLRRWEKQADRLIGCKASILNSEKAASDKARIQLSDAIWVVRAEQALRAGMLVEVIGYDNFELHVKIL